jgi:hypothetical protein
VLFASNYQTTTYSIHNTKSLHLKPHLAGLTKNKICYLWILPILISHRGLREGKTSWKHMTKNEIATRGISPHSARLSSPQPKLISQMFNQLSLSSSVRHRSPMSSALSHFFCLLWCLDHKNVTFTRSLGMFGDLARPLIYSIHPKFSRSQFQTQTSQSGKSWTDSRWKENGCELLLPWPRLCFSSKDLCTISRAIEGAWRWK